MKFQDFLCSVGKHDKDYHNEQYHQFGSVVVVIIPCKNCKELRAIAWYGKLGGASP